MKKVIEDLAAKAGLQTAYAGSSRIMYIKGDNHKVGPFIMKVRHEYPTLAFHVKNGNSVEIFAEVQSKDIKIAPPEQKEILQNPLEAIAVSPQFAEAFGKAVQEDAEAKGLVVKKKPTPEEVDAYLLANPVDRKAKGPYNTAAAHFDVKPDYIRGRWARLRELKLVEKETVTA